MPQSFFVGKKREMYEHPVFCLASQVMDLTIREYLSHSPASPSTSPLFYFYITTSMHSKHYKQPHICVVPNVQLVASVVSVCNVDLLVPWYWDTICLWACFLSFPKHMYFVCLRLECIFTLLVCKSSSVCRTVIHSSRMTTSCRCLKGIQLSFLWVEHLWMSGHVSQ